VYWFDGSVFVYWAGLPLEAWLSLLALFPKKDVNYFVMEGQ
jgi:hypothetical protein